MKRTTLLKLLIAFRDKLANLLATRSRLEKEIAEIGKRLENINIGEIGQKERARRKWDEKVQEENQKLGGVRKKINELELTKAELLSDLEKASKKNKKAEKILLRRSLLTKSVSVLTAELKNYENAARKDLQEEVNAILAEVAHKDYQCRLNPNFSLELMFSDGRPSPKSGGENQLLSLMFVASLVKFAASRVDDESVLLKPGTVAPLILDAPLGQLDMGYQESTATCNVDYQRLFTVSKPTASRDLEQLRSLGLLTKVGRTGKGTYYVLNPKRLTKGSKASPKSKGS